MRRQLTLILLSVSILVVVALAFVYLRNAKRQSVEEALDSESIPDPTTINSAGTKLVKNHRQVLGQQLPSFALVSVSGEKLSDDLIRHGNVILIFLASDCKACMENSDFFKAVVSTRKDVKYYGVRPYDKEGKSDKPYVDVVPFTVYFDQGHNLTRYLGVRGVPIAVFVKDGNIEKIWGGAVILDQEKVEFNAWLSSLYG